MRLANGFQRTFALSLMPHQTEAERDDAADLDSTVELPFGVDAYFNDHTLRTKGRALVQIVRLQGLYAEMLDDGGVDAYKHRRDTALQAIADSNIGVYCYDVRRRTRRWPGGTYRNWFARHLYERLKARFQQHVLYEHAIYIAVVRYPHYRGMVGLIDRMLHLFDPKGANDRLEDEVRQARDLEDKVNSLMKTLQHYAPHRLGRVQEDIEGERVDCCDIARFLRYLVSLEDGPVRATPYNLGQAMATAYKHFGRNPVLDKEVFEINGLGHHRIGQVLAMSRWPDGALAGMADRFHSTPAEFIITQKFFPIDKLDANRATSTSEARLSHDRVNEDLSAEMLKLRKRQAANAAVMGEHHMSVVVHVPIEGRTEQAAADALEALQLAVGKIGECFKGWAVPPVIETSGMERALWSQVPGAEKRHNGRVGKIESLQFACFASLHSFPQGKRDGNLWGECLMVLPTEGLTAYHLNWHEERPGMVPGHWNMSALTGRGKTLFAALMTALADKVDPVVHWFDNRNGATVFNAAMGGEDVILGLTRPLGNPCKMPDTEPNRLMLRELLQMMATCYGHVLTTEDIDRINDAVNDNFDPRKTKFEDRRLRNLAWRFGSRGSPLYRAMAIWHSDGANAAVFDNEHDTLDITKKRHYRYEMSELIVDKTGRPELPILLNYLTHRIEQTLTGQPAILIWDEAQILVRSPFWQTKIETYRETFRRRNCVTGFITPEPSALYTPVAAVRNQAVTSFYLAHDKADRRDYVDHLEFSESEFQFVKQIDPQAYKVLIKKGNGVSVRASFDMGDMPDLIAVLSSNDKSVALMHAVREELGTDDPEQWVPVFMKRALAERTHNV